MIYIRYFEINIVLRILLRMYNKDCTGRARCAGNNMHAVAKLIFHTQSDSTSYISMSDLTIGPLP